MNLMLTPYDLTRGLVPAPVSTDRRAPGHLPRHRMAASATTERAGTWRQVVDGATPRVRALALVCTRAVAVPTGVAL